MPWPPRRTLPAALLGLSLLLMDCTHSARFVPPITPPDPRSYAWNVDTIALAGSSATLMKSIWGSSSTDLYVAGHNDLTGGTMFHFDGSAWRRVGLTVSEGGSIQGNIDLSQVFGFTAVDVFAVGGKTPSGSPPGTPAQALVIHFDGISWSEVPVPPGNMLRGIWGQRNDEMWAVGDSGTALHEIGLNLLATTIPDAGSFNSVAGVSASDVYALSSRPVVGVHDTTFRSLWQWNGGVWAIVDSFPQVAGHDDKFGTRSVWSLLAVTYTCGEGVFRLNGSVWETIIPGTGSGYLNAMYGTTNASLFVVGDGGVAYHVNSAGPLKYQPITDASVNYYGVWTDGLQAYIVGNDGKRSYVLRGS